jgi:catechol 2,3-dioxygenase-like lactoylglutathione lyase family enzyme
MYGCNIVLVVHQETRRRRMTVTYIHTCYRILDPEKSKDFYVNKLGMKKLGEMDLGSATNNFFAMEGDASSPMLELRACANRMATFRT